MAQPRQKIGKVGLPITYRLTGAVQAHLKVQMDNSIQPYYVVEARIRGAQFADEWVLLGNHHDAWNTAASIPAVAPRP